MERSARERMARHGYARAELEREPTRAERFHAVLADLPEAARFLGRAARLAVAFHRAPPEDPNVLMRRIRGLNPEARAGRPDWRMPVVPDSGRLDAGRGSGPDPEKRIDAPRL